LLAIAVVGSTVYANSLNGAFLFDDDFGILKNVTLRHLWPMTAMLSPPHESPLAGRPLANASLALNFAVGGLHPFGYHVVNIALHVACAMLAFLIFKGTLASRALRNTFGPVATQLALAASLLWLVHPLTSEVVDYTVQRTESMMAFCLLLTLYASLRAANSRKWALISVLACAAGMACKESMVVAPILVVLYDLVFVYDTPRAAVRNRWRFYGALCSTWGVVAALLRSGPRSGSAGFHAGVTPWMYLLNQVPMLVRYARLTVWPKDLVLWYGPSQALALRDVCLPGILIICLVIAALLGTIRRRPLGFAAAWVFLTLAPTSSLVPIATEVGAERRMYLPLMMLAALAATTITLIATAVFAAAHRRATPRMLNGLLGLVTACVLVWLGALTVARNREYSTPLGMARTVEARWPTGGAHYMVGWELAQVGEHSEALAEYRRAVDTFPRARYYLASELAAAGDTAEAISQFQEFIREEPDLTEAVPAHVKLGRLVANGGHWDRAIGEAETTLSMDPSNADAELLIAEGFVIMHHFDDAFLHYRAYLEQRPLDVNALTGFAVALSQSGDDLHAADVFRRAVDIEPSNAGLRANLARALFLNDDMQGATAEAKASLALNPNDPSTHDLLGRTLALQGALDEAHREFEESLRLDPNDEDARAALNAFAILGRHRSS
jgi:tetratricopeptide (TPR) repeat protein